MANPGGDDLCEALWLKTTNRHLEGQWCKRRARWEVSCPYFTMRVCWYHSWLTVREFRRRYRFGIREKLPKALLSPESRVLSPEVSR